MRPHAPTCLALIAVLGWVIATPALAADVPQVLVLPMSASCLISEARGALDELLVSELSQRPELQIISMPEINLLLGMERLKDIAGCDTSACLAEIVGALGAPFFISGRVHEINGQLYFSLTLMDAVRSRVVRRAQVVYSDDEYFYVYAVRDLVRELFKTPRGAPPLVLAAAPPTDPHGVAAHIAAAAAVPQPPALQAMSHATPSCMARVAALQRFLGREFTPDEQVALQTCDALERELLTTTWGWQNRDRKDAVKAGIRDTRRKLRLPDHDTWPPHESCF